MICIEINFTFSSLYYIEQFIFIFQGCQCDVGGSVNFVCDKRNGQCKCRDNVIGRTCNKPRPGFYAPTLQQLSTEIEDGRAPDGNVISFDVQESKFPGYSGRGYSMINDMQVSNWCRDLSFASNICTSLLTF